MKNGKRILNPEVRNPRILKVSVKQIADFDPDPSYLEQEGFEDRLRQYKADQFCFIGIAAEAEYVLKSWGRWDANANMFTGGCGPIQTVHSGGLWGIESDSNREYLEEIETEQLAELKTELTALGFSKRAISKAFQNIERKD